jgi:hypothetical protein
LLRRKAIVTGYSILAGPTVCQRIANVGGSAAMRQTNYRVRAFPSQRRFYECQSKYSGFSGPVGSGKTHALVYRGLRAASANHRFNPLYR